MYLIIAADLHLRSSASKNRRVASRLKAIRAYCDRLDKKKEPWHLCIAGDVVDDGLEAQYAQARKLLAPFKHQLSMVPGNHDEGPLGNFYDRAAEDRFVDLALRISATEDPDCFLHLYDTNLHTANVLDFAQGYVTPSTLRALMCVSPRTIDRPSPPRVVLMHHTPFERDWFLRLQNAQDFLNATMGRVDLVICGHSHKLFVYDYPGNGRPTRTLYIQAPALCNSDGQPVVVDLDTLTYQVGGQQKGKKK